MSTFYPLTYGVGTDYWNQNANLSLEEAVTQAKSLEYTKLSPNCPFKCVNGAYLVGLIKDKKEKVAGFFFENHMDALEFMAKVKPEPEYPEESEKISDYIVVRFNIGIVAFAWDESTYDYRDVHGKTLMDYLETSYEIARLDIEL